MGVLAAVEVASALGLASINPARGWDENWYLINSYRFLGETTLPYASHRPPLFPMLLALFGDRSWLISALAHMGSTALVFLILRRVTAPSIALGGMIVFMASGSLRWYNVVLLTEMPAIFLLLLAVYFFLVERPLLFGATAALAVTMHWTMASVPAAAVVLYVLQRRWKACAWFLGGAGAMALPFLIAWAMAYGNPLAPPLHNLRGNNTARNDWWYYLRELSLSTAVLTAAGLTAVWWLLRCRQPSRRAHSYHDLCALLVGIGVARLAVLHAVTIKDVRFLVPLLPLFIMLAVLMMWHYVGRRRPALAAAYVVLLVSVLPGRQLWWRIHDLTGDPTNQLVSLKAEIANCDSRETIYTDFHDLAVMAQTGHPTVAVTDPGTWHCPLGARAATTRAEIPEGALYLTREPKEARVLARSEAVSGPALWLVRWQTEDAHRGS